MLLRRATDAELPEVVDLINVAFRGSEGWAVEFKVVEGERITLAGLREKVRAKPGTLLLVWRDESDDSLLGSVLLEPASDAVWYLGLLCVRPDAQTRQLGTTLLAASEDAAKERGAQRIRISVMTIRDTLVAWYERRGYVRTGEMRPFPYGDPSVGKPLRDDLEFAIMEKELRTDMADDISIRGVTRQDYDQWLPLWDGYNAFYGRAEATALSPDITSVTWERFFDSGEPVFALVAERDGELLGLTHYLFHRSTTSIEPTCYLQDLFTSEAARGKGVGRALIQAVYVGAKLAGSSKVYWQTHETNLTAMQLYDKVAERSGFLVYRKLL